MFLKNITIKDFRNISNIELSPCDGINVIYGNNAQGKTNIIEAIWLFTGNNSFRGGKISEFLKFDAQKSENQIVFEDFQREQKAVLKFANKKEILLNNVPLKKSSDLYGNFYCVVFSPDDLDLVKNSPKNRRKFLDLAISQIKPQYQNYLENYEKVLIQRNALLKDYNKSHYLRETLDIWDLQLAKLGTIISIYRNDYINKLKKISRKIYSGISQNKENFKINYNCNAFEVIKDEFIYDDENIQIYFNKLKDNLQKDISAKFTTVGVHRDDIDIFIDDILVKTYGSQGQQRSCVIVLKLSEAKILKLVTKENPIILLDDVMSELDKTRQDFILNHVKNKQVFITCCDYSNITNLNKGKIFKIENGALNQEKSIV